jgi:hypothetical protein
MRACRKCSAPDRAEIDPGLECKCGAVARGDEEHHPECPRLIHEVARYFVQIKARDLTPKRELSTYYRAQGWQLMEDGGRFFRWMLMCRQCFRDYEQVLAQQRDYQRACKLAKGMDDMSYSQMLARQSY